jgi:PPP family 3-phenylpropionic acid transporter
VNRRSRRRGEPAPSLPVLFALIGVAIAALFPFFSLFLRSRGLRADRIGFVLAAVALGSLVAGPVWGHVADTALGRIRTLRLSAFASIVVALSYALFARGFWPLLLGAAVLWSAWAPVVSIGDALAVVRLGDELVAYGRIRLWSSIGYAVAIVLIGAVLEGVALVVILPLFACAAARSWRGLCRARGSPRARGGEPPWGGGGRVPIGAGLVPLLGALLLVGVGWAAAWQFLPLRIVGSGGGAFLVGVAGGLGALVEVPVMRSTATLTTRLSLRAAYALGCATYIVVFLVWSAVDNVVVVSLLGALEGVGFALTYTSVVIIVGRLVPRRLQATGQAVRLMVVSGLAPILGALVGGIVYEHLGPPTLFVGAAALVMVGTVISWTTLSLPPFSTRTSWAGASS